MTTPNRKPRIGLMGEFSAGKSTLSNLLLGARPLPEKVTATRLSPVWMSAGTQAPYRIHMDGRHEPVTLENLSDIPVDETRAIRLFFESDVLDACDLIDFPGISDPNMSADVWQRMLDEVDAVLWCTHATQAWRQSEAAVWQTIPEQVRARSILLVTRFDKLKNDRDRSRVLARLNQETEGLFSATFPVSLTQALAAGEDYNAFERSGALAFVQHFAQMAEDLAAEVGDQAPAGAAFEAHTQTIAAAAEPSEAVEVAEPNTSEVAENTPVQAVEPPSPDAPVAQGVVPRRVRVKASETARPRAKPAPIDMSLRTVSNPTPAVDGDRASETPLRAVFQENQPPAE